MLLYPSVDYLKTKVDSKYTLAIMAAKRARDLIDGKPMLTLDTENEKPLSVATFEIAEDLISYERKDDSAEEAKPAAEKPMTEETAEAEEKSEVETLA